MPGTDESNTWKIEKRSWLSYSWVFDYRNGTDAPGNTMTEKVVVRNLYKIFGEHPEEALKLLQEGVGKGEIFNRTNQTVGVLVGVWLTPCHIGGVRLSVCSTV